MEDLNYIDQFIGFLAQIKEINDDAKSALKGFLKVRHIAKNTTLLKSGEICNNCYFVIKGLGVVRVDHGLNFEIKEISKEDDSVSRFSREGSLLMSPVSFYGRKPSLEIIQTLEESTLVEFSYESLQFMYENFPDFNYIGRALTEKYFILAEERAYILRNHNRNEKWEWFKLNYPFLLNGRVAQHDIAKFLGISREYLNKIIKK